MNILDVIQKSVPTRWTRIEYVLQLRRKEGKIMNKFEKFNFEKFKKESRKKKWENEKLIFEEYYYSRRINYYLGKQIIEHKNRIYSLLITEKSYNENLIWSEIIITKDFLNALKTLKI